MPPIELSAPRYATSTTFPNYGPEPVPFVYGPIEVAVEKLDTDVDIQNFSSKLEKLMCEIGTVEVVHEFIVNSMRIRVFWNKKIGKWDVKYYDPERINSDYVGWVFPYSNFPYWLAYYAVTHYTQKESSS